jgi:hypothetical protein
MGDIQHDKLPHLIAMVDDQTEGNHGADVVTHYIHSHIAALTDQLRKIVRHALFVIAVRGFVGASHASQVHRDHAVRFGQLRHDLVIRPPGLGPTWK